MWRARQGRDGRELRLVLTGPTASSARNLYRGDRARVRLGEGGYAELTADPVGAHVVTEVGWLGPDRVEVGLAWAERGAS